MLLSANGTGSLLNRLKDCFLVEWLDGMDVDDLCTYSLPGQLFSGLNTADTIARESLLFMRALLIAAAQKEN